MSKPVDLIDQPEAEIDRYDADDTGSDECGAEEIDSYAADGAGSDGYSSGQIDSYDADGTASNGGGLRQWLWMMMIALVVLGALVVLDRVSGRFGRLEPLSVGAPGTDKPAAKPAPAKTESIRLDGGGGFPLVSYYPVLKPGPRVWRDVRFDIGRTGLMAKRGSDATIRLNAPACLQKLYVLQCARGDFAGNETVGTLQLVYTVGEPGSVSLVVGQTTQYPDKKTASGIGPEGFHVVELTADPQRTASAIKVTASSSARIHVLAAAGQLAAPSPRPAPPGEPDVVVPKLRQNLIVTGDTDLPMPATAAPTRYLPVPLNQSPIRSTMRDGVPFSVHRIPVETTSVLAQRGLRIGLAHVQRVHFMHCGRRNLAGNQQVGYYEMRFSDGSVERFDLVTQRSINYPDWSRPGSTRSPGDPEGLDVFLWQNPQPSKTLQTIDLVGSNSVTIQLWALTLEHSGELPRPGGRPEPKANRPVRVSGTTPKVK